MNDGYLHRGSLHSDIREFHPTAQLSATTDGLIGGFPCQVPFVSLITLFIDMP